MTPITDLVLSIVFFMHIFLTFDISAWKLVELAVNNRAKFH